MEGIIFLDPEPCGGVAGDKTRRGNVVKGDSMGDAPKKILADISNQQQQELLKPLNQQAKHQSAPLVADNSIDQLLKENAMLMKLLANRNAVLETCKAELQKFQSNFQKLRKQNSELAKANSQMLVELNSSRQRLRELQHELGSKNGILKAMKIELTEKENTAKSKHEIDANEVGTSQSKQSDQTFQADSRTDNLCQAKKRRVSRSQSSAPAVIKQVKSTEKVDNQRYCLRRQSTGLKAEKPGSTEDLFEVDEIKYDVSHLQENLANEKALTSLGSTVQGETREVTESSGPATTEQVHAKENLEKKRHSLRRQSARFKPENPEPTEDFFKIDDEKFAISHLCDSMVEKSGPTTASLTFGQENKENNASKLDPEIRRSSVGRPLRRTVEKVQSYKEIPLNVKMRRPD